MNVFNDRVVITGGISHDEDVENTVWEGAISFNPNFNVKWTRLPSMLQARYDHVAAVLNNKLYCIGGSNYELINEGMQFRSSEYLSKDKKSWKSGPSLDFSLNTAKYVVDEASQICIITGGNRNRYDTSNKVSIFHATNGLKDIGELNTSLEDHIAVLL